MACRVRRQALEDVGEIAVRVVPVQLRRLDQAHDDRCSLAGTQRAGEQPVRPTERHHAAILPISGRKLKFTIAGIRSTTDEFERITANNAPAAVSAMLRPSRAS